MKELEKLKNRIDECREDFPMSIQISIVVADRLIDIIEKQNEALLDLSSTEWSWERKPTEKEPRGVLKNTFVIKERARKTLSEVSEMLKGLG